MSLDISLPEPLQAFVEKQVEYGGYATASEYLQALVLEDQKRKAKTQERLEELLLEGLNSGPGEPITEQYWEDIRREVRARLAARNGAQVS